jgi:C-terminal processing protease CtpA/Prc
MQKYLIWTVVLLTFVFRAVAWTQEQPQLVSQPNRQRELTTEERLKVLTEAWGLVKDTFYDPKLNGVPWDSVKSEFTPQFEAARTAGEVADLLRQLVATLHASHIGLLTHEEYIQTQHILPFFFERVNGLSFVSYVFEPKDGSTVPLRVGDELISVDGSDAKVLRLPSVTSVYPVFTNPYYGPAGSTAALRIRRSGSELVVNVQRIRRFDDVRAMCTNSLDGNIQHVRFLKFDSGTVPLSDISALLKTVSAADALIIDLRNCVGGDDSVDSLLSGALIGSDMPLYASLKRGMTAQDSGKTTAFSRKTDSPFTKPVAVLVNGNTESEPEVFTAVMKEYKRVRVFGSTTRGAFNGASEATGLSFKSGILAIPVERVVTAAGNEYEGRGVTPDSAIANTEQDFAAGRDAVLDAAVAYLRRICN